MGVWIEMAQKVGLNHLLYVTPLVGVWIEINLYKQWRLQIMSLPLWECGLKFSIYVKMITNDFVTPLVGVWIEINTFFADSNISLRHSPCGSVD